MLKENILEYMREEAYRPMSAESLAEAMNINDTAALNEFWQALHELEDTAQIVKTKREKYGIPARMNLMVGRLSMTSKGFGFVVPDVRQETRADLFIPTAMLASAMNNDRVIARINTPVVEGKSGEGEIIRIVERANKKIVGTFESSRSFGFVVPDDVKLGNDIFVERAAAMGAKTGAKVVVEITRWPERRRSAEGRIIEILGFAGDPGVDILSIIKKHDLPLEFPAEVCRETDKVPDKGTAADMAGRKDRRELPIITIDGDDAKDLDDGVYVKQLDDKNYLLGVYIADVSHYVGEGSELDREAENRGTSVYLVDRVIPMLPQRLSNGICSLNAGEDRLSMSVEMNIDSNGRIKKYEIFPSIIHVHRRMTYNIVSKILIEHDKLLTEDNADILEMLESMKRLSLILRRKRQARGSLDFDIPEVKVRLDEQGKPVRLIKRVHNLAESIIEEFMLAANETVAEHMTRMKQPFIYRVHEEPDESKLENLGKLLAAFTLRMPRNNEDKIPPAVLQDILKQVEGRPEERIISMVMLRSMKQARYEAENLGHYGLAATYYTHFTSPIRRYPDLLVHRLLRETFATGSISPKRQDKWRAALPELAAHASQRERLAAEAERETTDLKKVEYMVQFIGEKFSGIISGVTAFGIFVELESGVEGLVRVSGMEDDYYQYVEERYALIGERSGREYRLGEPVEIVVQDANVAARTIDFILADNGTLTLNRDSAVSRKTRGEKQHKSSKPDCRADKPQKAGTADKVHRHKKIKSEVPTAVSAAKKRSHRRRRTDKSRAAKRRD